MSSRNAAFSEVLTSGGVSGTILDDLSGSYKTFTEAVKEAISNAYDADAQGVSLQLEDLGGEDMNLHIADDGAGMDPVAFVRDYIRVGRSVRTKTHSPSGARERIGGKGIGSLAPARYCQRLVVTTKSAMPLVGEASLPVSASGQVSLSDVFPYIQMNEALLGLFDDLWYTTPRGKRVTLQPGGDISLPELANGFVQLGYRFRAERCRLQAHIDFREVRELGERLNLEEIVRLWHLTLEEVDPKDYERHGTTLLLQNLENFVVRDLRAPGKPQARNISSKTGFERFVWSLSRICPVPVAPEDLERLPTEIRPVANRGDELPVKCSTPIMTGQVLTRPIYCPPAPLNEESRDLYRAFFTRNEAAGIEAVGYVMGSSTLIYPAELRGISVRVKGVGLGAPSLFGADALVTGPALTALTSHITGEVHVLAGVDARRDILPGREGLYPESPVYRELRRALAGGDDVFGGILKEIVGAILARSEAAGSAKGFVGKMESQRNALLSASEAIASLVNKDESLLEALLSSQPEEPQLLYEDDVEFRPEGHLSSYTLVEDTLPRGIDFKVDYVNKRLLVPKGASFLQRTIDIGGEVFEVVYKRGRDIESVCEIDPDNRMVYINWDHPIRGSLGDSTYLKHCLAAVICGLDQESLNRYVQLITAKT